MARWLPFSRLLVMPVLLAVVALAVACSAASARSEPGGNVGNRAPEFEGISDWINSEPLTMEELRGKVVLIDFWTYTCVNCIRTLPYTKEWHDKYADEGLVIVGVHAPEFEFEKLTEKVENSVQEFDLTYPIAQDNEMGTWSAYSNRAWPAKYLVGKDGFVRYKHFGERSYQETESQIRDALRASGASLSNIYASVAEEPRFDGEARSRNLEKRITREIYVVLRSNNNSGVF